MQQQNTYTHEHLHPYLWANIHVPKQCTYQSSASQEKRAQCFKFGLHPRYQAAPARLKSQRHSMHLPKQCTCQSSASQEKLPQCSKFGLHPRHQASPARLKDQRHHVQIPKQCTCQSSVSQGKRTQRSKQGKAARRNTKHTMYRRTSKQHR